MRAFISFLALLLLVSAPRAEGDMLLGKFQLLNTDGFVEQNGVRTPLERDPGVGSAILSPDEDGTLLLNINGTEIRLFKLPNGLATLTWDAHNSSLLQGVDIQALSKGKPADEIPAWGANVNWPDLGQVQIVILPLGPNANTGFLVSHPGGKTVVRQMELRKIFGPSNRPGQKAFPSFGPSRPMN